MSATLFISCDNSLQEQLVLAGTNPSHLLSIYASLLGGVFVFLIAFGRRGIWWALVDSVCVVGLICLATCPIYWVTSGQWKIATAIGVSGLLSLLSTSILYWRYNSMPERRSLFSDDESEDGRQDISEEDE